MDEYSLPYQQALALNELRHGHGLDPDLGCPPNPKVLLSWASMFADHGFRPGYHSSQKAFCLETEDGKGLISSKAPYSLNTRGITTPINSLDTEGPWADRTREYKASVGIEREFKDSPAVKVMLDSGWWSTIYINHENEVESAEYIAAALRYHRGKYSPEELESLSHLRGNEAVVTTKDFTQDRPMKLDDPAIAEISASFPLPCSPIAPHFVITWLPLLELLPGWRILVNVTGHSELTNSIDSLQLASEPFQLSSRLAPGVQLKLTPWDHSSPSYKETILTAQEDLPGFAREILAAASTSRNDS